MPLFAGRKMLYSLDRGRRGISPPSSIAGLRCLCGRKHLLLSLAKCIFAALNRSLINAKENRI